MKKIKWNEAEAYVVRHRCEEQAQLLEHRHSHSLISQGRDFLSQLYQASATFAATGFCSHSNNKEKVKSCMELQCSKSLLI